MLSEFINFNRNCPICFSPLTIYMQWMKYANFKGSYHGNGEFHFIPSDEKNVHRREGMILNVQGNSYTTEFTSAALHNESRKWQIYFFYLCNPKGLVLKPNGKHEIHLHKGCYYRSSPCYEFVLNQEKDTHSKRWTMELTDPEQKHIVNKTERFCLKQENDGKEKVYMLSLNYLKQNTEFWYYTATEEEKKDNQFSPNIFTKELPLLKNRPDLTDKRKLMERFDSWIIMS